MTALVQRQPKQGLMATMAARFGMDTAALEQTLTATIFPGGKPASREQVASFMVVANQYELNPFTREIYAFPGKSGGIQPIVGVDGWARIASRHPDFDGLDFAFEEGGEDGLPLACTCTVYRKGSSHPVVVTEYLAECKRNTEPWTKWPRRMLRHKAFVQSVRLAFGISGIQDEDDAERWREVEAIPVPEVAAAKRADKVAEKIAVARGKRPAAPAPVEVEPQAEVVMVEQEQPAADQVQPAPQLTSEQRRLAWINDAINFGGERVERLLAGTSPEAVASDSEKYVSFKAKAKAVLDSATA